MLKNKSVVVTGSTSGIGFGIAQAMARSGANVMLNGFGEATMIEKLRSYLATETGVLVLHHPADVSQPAEVAALIAATESAFGSVDVLVNNAGIQHVAPIDEFPDEKWTAIKILFDPWAE